MATTMPASVGPREVKVGDPQGTLPLVGEARGGAGFTETPESARWILRVIDRSLQRSLSVKEACAALGIDKSQLRRQLDGDGHLSVYRLGALPEVFWRSMLDELRVEFDMADRAALIEQGEALIDRGRQLLAKAAAR